MRARQQTALVTIVIVAILLVSSFVYLRQGKPANGDLTASETTSSARPKAATYITEYQVGGNNSQPNGIASDSKGDIWYTLSTDYAIGELVPSNGSVHEFKIPGQRDALVSSGIAVDSSTGKVWFTDQLNNSLWSFDIATASFTRYPLPTTLSSPYQVAVDSAGNAWFTEIDGGRIGEVTTQGTLREFTIPTSSTTSLVGPAGIALAKNGVVWFAEVYRDAVASLSNGTFAQYPIPGGNSPTGIAMDQKGNLWVTLHGGSDVAEVDPTTNSSKIISTSLPGEVKETLPYFVQVDPQGNVWFNEHYGNAIARYTPSNQTLVEYEIPSKVASLGNISGALTIGLDSSGHPWFAEDYTGKIGTVSLTKPTSISITVDSMTGQEYSVTVHGGADSTLTSTQGSGPALAVSFAPSLGSGSYSSVMTVATPTTPTGEGIELTVSAVTPELVSSQVVQVLA